SLAAEMPEDLVYVANRVEVLTGMTLDPRTGSIQLLDNTAWLASRERLEQEAGPRMGDEGAHGGPQGHYAGLAWALAEARSQYANEQNAVAWGLATTPDPKQRDPARAVALAREAVGLFPKSGMLWNTLGVALYRAGDYQGVIAALEKS